MNLPVFLLDLLCLPLLGWALYTALAARLRGLRRDYLWCLVVVLALRIFNDISNVLYSSGISAWLENYEDYVGLLLPVAWGLLLLSLVQHRARRQLERSEERLSSLLDALQEGVATLDTDGVFRFANPAASRILGVLHGSLPGQPLTSFRQPLPQHDHCPLTFNGSALPALHYELSLRRPDGSERSILLSTSLMPRKPGLRLCFLRDMTEQRQAEQSLRQAEAKLGQTQRMEAIGTLASGIAHDFNNILFAISGNSQIALDSEGLNIDARESLREIDTASRRAADLVSQILSFSRREQRSSRDLAVLPIVKEVLRLLRSTVPPQIRISLEHGGDELLVHAEPTDLHQLVMNLCTNAIQELARDGGELKVSLACAEPPAALLAEGRLRPGPHCRLCVADNGGGIDPGARPHIFEPFFTTKEHGEGTGLGLFVVNGIVERLQGRLELESSPGSGCSFTIWLPLASSLTAEDGNAPDRLSQRGGRGRLLVVDDEPAVNRVLALLLGKLGYEVSTFSDSYRALSEFQTNPERYDMLLCDISMPGLRGDELVRRIHAIRPELPVVFCSGNPEVLAAGTTDELGIRSVLKKPVDKSALAEAVAGCFSDQAD
ncbi:response regulator [bacterium]|nr:response regulator [bacterium]